MKRILFILSMLGGVAYGQSIGYWRYDTVVLQKIGGNSELKIMNGTRGVAGGVLTNMGNGRTSFVAPSGLNTDSLFGLQDRRATAARYFSAANQTFILDSLGDNTLLRQRPKVGTQSRFIKLSNSDGTDSAYVYVGGKTVGSSAKRQFVMGVTSVGGGSSAVTGQNNDGNSSYLNMFTNNGSSGGLVQVDSQQTYMFHGLTSNLSRASNIYLYNDSTSWWVGEPRTSALILHTGFADQYARDSLIWRTEDRESFYFLSHGFAHIYTEDSLLFESESGVYRYTDLLATVDTTNFKPGGYDASGNLKRLNYWPGGGGGSTPTLQQVLTAGSTLTVNNTIIPSASGKTVTWGNGTSGSSVPFDEIRNYTKVFQIKKDDDGNTAFAWESEVKGGQITLGPAYLSIGAVDSITFLAPKINMQNTPLYGNSNAYNNQTGTSYTLLSTDNGKIVTISNGSAITLTVPASLPAGFNCTIIQKGAGQITFTASSTTINNRQSFTKTKGQYSMVTIVQYGTNLFITQGDME